MDEFGPDISELKERLKDINEIDLSMRMNQIDDAMRNGNLDFSSWEFTPSELTYIHARLHFFHHMKNPPIDQDQISKYHIAIKNLMKDHINFDYLDQK